MNHGKKTIRHINSSIQTPKHHICKPRVIGHDVKKRPDSTRYKASAENFLKSLSLSTPIQSCHADAKRYIFI